ncbi:hypothetical protein NX821_001205 [Clostridium septicum]|uniref:hypothetical protein n=1 Tax=Clostridium septicum TaxID=1504 RepID=UPI00272DFB30|nr:hypothetical protein [Clostridium septicum]WLF70550.1 hypothetical protein Q6375_06060 [Clostridium septicum]
MKEFKIFKLLDKFKGIYIKSGVDYDLMKLILSVKLTMDKRRTSTIFNGKRKETEDSNNFIYALVVYAFYGFFMMFLVVFKMNIMYQMSLYFSMFMFMILTIFISDYSSVILDVRDKNIIGTKGVNLETINAAKMTHVIIYLVYLTLAMAGFSLVASLRYGIFFFLVFLIDIILIDLLMIMITALAYFLVLKFFDGEKLKDIINIVQIILSIFMISISQIIPRMFNIVDLTVSYIPKIKHFLIPPMWFAAPLEMIVNNNINVNFIIMTILAILVPIIIIGVYLKLIPSFEQYLQKLNNNTCNRKKSKEGLNKKIGKLICRNREERIFYNFTNDLITSEREYKLKVYPNVAMGLVFPLIFMFIGKSNKESFGEWIARLPESKSFLCIYIVVIIIPTVIMMMKFSEKYKGAWIYQVTPIQDLAAVFKGTIKALYVKLIMPVILILSALYIFLYSFGVIKHLIVVFLVSILVVIMSFSIGDKALPFTTMFKAGESGGGDIASTILVMFLMGIIVGVHYLATLIPGGVYIYSIIILAIDILLWRKVFKIPRETLIS